MGLNLSKGDMYKFVNYTWNPIKGKCLHVDEMSLESGDISITGDVKSMVYGDKDRTKKPTLWGKITR